MSEEQSEEWEWDVRIALLAIQHNPPKWKGPDEDGVGEFEPYDALSEVEILSEALGRDPALVARMASLSDYDHALLVGRMLVAKIREEKGRDPTKGELMIRLEQDYPDARKAISKSDPIPSTTATRYFEKARLSHLEQDRGWS